MRILLSSNHQYPSFGRVGSGLRPKPSPSGSGGHIHDLLAKGLAELGHEVFYLLSHPPASPLPVGVTYVSEPVPEADVLHRMTHRDEDLVEFWRARGKPWVTTCHLDLRIRGGPPLPPTEDWIFVSRTMARSYNSGRYVLNGLNPDDYVYSENKNNYLLFMASIDWASAKGLNVALELSRSVGVPLVVAGTSKEQRVIDEVTVLCKGYGADYVGDMRGAEKAWLLAGAKAFLFPTQINDAFGLGMVEALLSGTPVICSGNGACPEIISPDVGFVCRSREEYIQAVERVGQVRPQNCREKGMTEYHYLRMAKDYLKEYEREIACAQA